VKITHKKLSQIFQHFCLQRYLPFCFGQIQHLWWFWRKGWKAT